jgi:two-component system response regulator
VTSAEKASIQVTTSGPVVMVDDNPGDVELARLGYEESSLEKEWVAFSGGRGFLSHMADVREGTATMPSLVLLDLNMPDMTGFEVLKKVRSDSFFEAGPIFCMLTSSGDPRDRANALRLGVAGFFVKPDTVDRYVEFFHQFR